MSAINPKNIVRSFIVVKVLVAVGLFANISRLSAGIDKDKVHGRVVNDKAYYDDLKSRYPNLDIVHNDKEGLWDKAGTPKIGLRRVWAIKDEVDTDTFISRSLGIVSDSRNNLFIKHKDDGAIVMLNAQGQFVKKIGRRGSGPGEMHTKKVLFMHRDTLHVLDQGNARFMTFTADGDYIDTHKIDGLVLTRKVWSFVINGQGHYVLSFFREKSGLPLHAYGRDGQYIRSFGVLQAYEAQSHWHEVTLKYENGRGHLHKGNSEDYYYAPLSPYEIHHYDSTGQMIRLITRKTGLKPEQAQSVVYMEEGREWRELKVAHYPVFTCIWGDYLIHVRKLGGPGIGRVRTSVDVFSREGQWLQSMILNNFCKLNCIDGEGYLIGALYRNDDYTKIVKYQLYLLD